MDIRRLKYFLAIAEHQHMSRAAERLHVTQPSLSQQMGELERELGVTLFDRLPRGIRLTRAGESLMRDARDILARMDEAAERVRRAGRGELGRLRIAFNEIAGQQQIVGEAFHYFRNDNPDVELRLEPLNTFSQIEALREGRIDAGFQFNLNQERELLECLTIRKDRYKLALPRGHRLLKRRTISIDDLRDEPFVWLHRSVNPLLHDQLVAFCASHRFTPHIIQEAQNDLGQINLVSVGMGVAFVIATQRWGRSDAVEFRRVAGLSIPLDFVLAWRRDDTSPLLARFVRSTKALIRQVPVKPPDPLMDNPVHQYRP